jgi:hypothetical protein
METEIAYYAERSDGIAAYGHNAKNTTKVSSALWEMTWKWLRPIAQQLANRSKLSASGT